MPRSRQSSLTIRRKTLTPASRLLRPGTLGLPGTHGRRRRMGTQREYHKVTREELEKLAGEELPERAAMSLINANIAIPVNAAIAANVLSDNAIAYAEAAQETPIDQSN